MKDCLTDHTTPHMERKTVDTDCAQTFLEGKVRWEEREELVGCVEENKQMVILTHKTQLRGAVTVRVSHHSDICPCLPT